MSAYFRGLTESDCNPYRSGFWLALSVAIGMELLNHIKYCCLVWMFFYFLFV